MKSVRIYGPGDVRLDEIPDPGPPAPNQLLAAPTWAGICGTDVKEFVGGGGFMSATPHPITGATFPQALGHEFSARVLEVGSDVRRVRPGDLLAVMPLLPCQRCWACDLGEWALCPEKAWIGLSSPWGGFTDRVVLEEFQATTADDLTDLQAALVEPAAVALQAARRAEVGPGDLVLVVGAGPVGMLAMQACILSGATAVLVSEVNAERAAIASSLGATDVLTGAAEEQIEAIFDFTGGRGVDRAIDCAGKPGTLDLCIAATRKGGVISVPSVANGPSMVDVRSLTRKPVAVVGSLGYSQAVWRQTIRLIARGSYPVERIVTSTIRRESIVSEGFELLARGNQAELKILVDIAEYSRTGRDLTADNSASLGRSMA